MKLFGICLFSFMLSCSTDVSIMKRVDDGPADETGLVQAENTPGIEDQDTDTQTDTNDSSETMTELTIGFAQISLTQIACPACMGVSNEFDISANLKLHQPTTGNYTEHLPATGVCITQEVGTYVSSTPINIAGIASFNSIQLYPSGQAEWSSSNLAEYQIPRREVITVVTESGIIENAFETLEGFDDIQPWELRYVDPSYAFAAVVSKQGTTFTWYPIISDALFEVMVVVYSPDGSQILGLVKCMENDVGYLNIPGSYFQTYPTWALAAVYLTRHRIDRRPAPNFNGYLESHQTWTVLGTAHIE